MEATVKTKAQSTTASKAYTEFDKLGVISLAVVAGLVGIWSFVAFGAAVSSIGLAGLAKGFLVAIGLV